MVLRYAIDNPSYFHKQLAN